MKTARPFFQSCDVLVYDPRSSFRTVREIRSVMRAVISVCGLHTVRLDVRRKRVGVVWGMAILRESHFFIEARSTDGFVFASVVSCRAFSERTFADALWRQLRPKALRWSGGER